MNTKSIGHLARKIEPGIVVLLLLYFFKPQLPPLLAGFMKYGSYGLIALLILGVGIGRWQRLAYVATRDLFPWLLLGLSWASVIWSAAPRFTSDEVDVVIRATLFGTYLAMRYTPKELMRLVGWTLGIAAVLSVVYAVVLPSRGISDGLWKGIFQHKQYLGRAMVIGAITFLNVVFDQGRDRWLPWAGVGLAVTLVLLSQSKSALLLLLLSLSLFPLQKFVNQGYRLRVVLFIAAFLLVGTVALLIVSNLETIVVEILGKNMEFNGRVPVWTLAIEKGLERPWLGYGYAGFWTSDEASYILDSTWAGSGGGGRFHAHNGFIDVFLQLGFVGLSLCLLSFLMLTIRTVTLISSTKSREFFWIFQFLIISFLANASEVRTFVGGGTMWILYVSISFSTAVWCKRIRRKYDRMSHRFEEEKLIQEL